MSVHMFRAHIGIGEMTTSDLETRINDWVASNPEWESDTVDHTLRERNTKIDGSGETYYSVDVRFREDDTKANLLQKLTDKLKDKVGWYRVAYHSCTHDGTMLEYTETKSLAPGSSVSLERRPSTGTVSVSQNGTRYEHGTDYSIENDTMLVVPDESVITQGEYTVLYASRQCEFDDVLEWTAKDVTIPEGVPTYNA